MWRRDDTWIEAHERQPLFATCSRSELRLVSAVTTRLVVPPGKVLVHEGARPSALVVVRDGAADARRDGRQVEAISTGGHFGEIALVRGICEPGTVVARTPMTVDVVGPREFRTLYAVVDSFRDAIDREIDRRVPSWLTPRPTVVAGAPRWRTPATAAVGSSTTRSAKGREPSEPARRTMCACGRRSR
jgi:hypothetical protein